ncbi:MAG TPA: MarR family transcriptional regulator [Candidatus Limnocylindrales bacterium]
MSGTAGVPTDRADLEREVIDEMTSWSPRDRSGAFKQWHRHSLSLVHLHVLTTLETDGPMPMSRLAEAMDVSDASATGIVDRMEKRGLVERRHGTEDRRTVLVHPTDAGEQVFRDMAEHGRSLLTKVLAELKDEEMTALLVGMRAIGAAKARLMADITKSGMPCPDGPVSAPIDSPGRAGPEGPPAD